MKKDGIHPSPIVFRDLNACVPDLRELFRERDRQIRDPCQDRKEDQFFPASPPRDISGQVIVHGELLRNMGPADEKK